MQTLTPELLKRASVLLVQDVAELMITADRLHEENVTLLLEVDLLQFEVAKLRDYRQSLGLLN